MTQIYEHEEYLKVESCVSAPQVSPLRADYLIRLWAPRQVLAARVLHINEDLEKKLVGTTGATPTTGHGAHINMQPPMFAWNPVLILISLINDLFSITAYI